MAILKKLNQNFFKTWNEDMAYILGFFAADGSMLRNKRGAHYIEFQVTDKDILVAIRKAVGSNHAVTTRMRNKKWKAQHRLQIGSKEWFHDLSRLGFSQRKSKTICMPHVPICFRASFVRGYFDGDGGVYFTRYKSKDRAHPRWVFSSRFTSGSKEFLGVLHQILKESAGVCGGRITGKVQRGGFDLILSHHDSVALCRFMYNNGPRIYIQRKCDVFRKALYTLYGEKLRA